MKHVVEIDVDIDLIQQVRLVHALCESDSLVQLPNDQLYKFTNLIHKFKISFIDSPNILDVSKKNINFSQIVTINHEKPFVKIGHISKPLVFPYAIAKYCKSIWKLKRKQKFVFPGLITEKRKQVILNWLIRNNKENFISKIIFNSNNYLYLFEFMTYKFGLKTIKLKIKDLLIWQSINGRFFPIKSWDENYYELLSNSKFVLCPDGDFTWSYRFFESILCGAIPVIENYCEAYEGFHFYYMHENSDDFTWDYEKVKKNYDLCVGLITFSSIELNELIDKLSDLETFE